MKKDNKIIDLNDYKNNLNIESSESKEQNYDFEEWEADHDFLTRGDFEGLVRYREMIIKNNPNDYCSKWYLAEAYVLNKEFEKAIKYLIPLHKEDPDDENITFLILDALFALGKNENNFEWKVKPIIVELNVSILDRCYDFLKLKRKGRTVSDLYSSFMTEGYTKFDGKDLYNALLEDNRFNIEKDFTVELSLIKVKKKKDI